MLLATYANSSDQRCLITELLNTVTNGIINGLDPKRRVLFTVTFGKALDHVI